MPEFAITTDESSREFICKRLDAILNLMYREHHVCSTHSERNAYQAVIRIELQSLRDSILYHRTNPGSEDVNFIPF